MIKAKDLVRMFQEALDGHWGYIYGMTHEMWSLEKQAAYEKEHAGDPERAASCQCGAKWVGHWVTDCSGLFAYSFAQLGGKIAHGSNSIWNNHTAGKGTLLAGMRTDHKPLLPGTAVFTSDGDRHNHIGLYIGNGMVIEAQGTLAGVVTSMVTNKKWTHWAELKNVSYENDEGGDTKMNAIVVLPTGAKGNTVNMREKPSKGSDSKIVTRVPVGATVEVIQDKGQWCFIDYGDKTGWMMSDYLEYGGSDGESSEETISVPREKLEAIYDEIGGWLGLRG